MDAAIACFRRRGFHQSTMQEICAEASISAGALYRYFSSKAEIIAAIAEDSHGDADTAFIQTAKTGFVDALCLVAVDFFQKFDDGDGAVIAEIIAEGIRDEALAASLLATQQHSIKMLVREMRAAQERGDVDPTLDLDLTVNTLFAALEGIGLRRAFARDTDPAAAVAQFRILAERYLSPRHEQA